ncbi:MAG: type II toxin-antitoxin system PrlF family antitoxin [Deltaproteobacteria bacterium]|nr:type II toxin-antitoxin system PrlF family antitoxin [Deltaproteobacteria bacterium]
MLTSKITSKGQITLPRAIRDFLKLGTGDRVDFVIRDNGEVIVRPKSVSVQSLHGSIEYHGKPISIEKMNEAIAQSIRPK